MPALNQRTKLAAQIEGAAAWLAVGEQRRGTAHSSSDFAR